MTMKKILLSGLSVLLCFALLLPTTAYAAAPDDIPSAQSVFDSRTDRMHAFTKGFNAFSNAIVTTALKILGLLIPNTTAVSDYRSFRLDDYEYFYTGNETFLDAPAENAHWSLGYAKESIVPDDLGERAYTIGGYGPMHETTDLKDDLCVRVVVLDDGSGRGKTVFAVLDAIGIANADVRRIRQALWLYAKQQNIVSVNVSVTHTHSGIDLQGVWNKTVSNVFNNITRGLTCYCNIQSGVDATFLQKVIDSTQKAVKNAVDDMQPGTLTLTKKNISDYVSDRNAPTCLDENLYRLLFTPADDNTPPTVIATYGAHHERAGFGSNILSADSIYYTDALLERAGYRYIFIQGCIGTVTYGRGNSNDGLDNSRYEEAVRYGYEMGMILLSLTRTQQECAALNDALGDPLGVAQYGAREGYTVWYRDWQPVTEKTVEPLLNIRHTQYILPVTNPLLTIVGRVGITDCLFLLDRLTRRYYTVTESGYMELGTSLKVAISPGETYGELLLGGEGIDGFPYPSLRSLYGEDLIVFDLMNDAIGYLEPDNAFVYAGAKYDPQDDELNWETWCLISSYGKHTASEVIKAFIALADSVRS